MDVERFLAGLQRAQDETTSGVNTSAGLSLPRQEERLSFQADSWATTYSAAMRGFPHKGSFLTVFSTH